MDRFQCDYATFGIGLLGWYYATNREDQENSVAPSVNPLSGTSMTPSMKATLKYFWVVTALILVQILMGVVTAHYGVEGLGFYGLPLADFLPYSISRTWHIQLAIFWIATSWLATGLFIAPAVSGKEPKYQKAGVNFLFIALLSHRCWISGRAMDGGNAETWTGENFYFGHQGYEYVDLGRFWQAFLVYWLVSLVVSHGQGPFGQPFKKDRKQASADHVSYFFHCHCFLLWCGIDVGTDKPTLLLQNTGDGGWFISG